MSNSNIDEILFKIRTTHEVEHNDNQWTTEFVYTLEEAKQAIQQELLKAELKGFDKAFDSHDYDGLRKYKSDLQAKLKGE